MKLVSQSVEILQWIEVPSQEIAFEVNDDKVVIKPPSAYLGYKPIQLMLISYKWRGAQVRLIKLMIIVYYIMYAVSVSCT